MATLNISILPPSPDASSVQMYMPGSTFSIYSGMESRIYTPSSELSTKRCMSELLQLSLNLKLRLSPPS